MRYVEYPPGPRLAPYVRCYWVLESDAPPPDADPERVLPDGCCEIIVHHGDPFRRLDETGRAVSQERCLFAGPIQRFLLLRPEGRVGMFGIRFEPGGARPFVDDAVHEIGSRVVALRDIWNGLTDELENRLRRASDDRTRLAVAEDVLIRRLAAARFRPDVQRVVERLVASSGALSVDEAARGLFDNRRKLERAFREHVGLSPKRLARITRFQTVFQCLDVDPTADWARVAADCGYYDQSHLNRDFRDFAGLPPTRYAAAINAIGACFVEKA